MIRKIILFHAIILFRLAFGQDIYHQDVNRAISGVPLEIDILVDLNGESISNFELFYKTNNQLSFFRQNIFQKDLANYSSFIPAEFMQGEYIEYYIVLEMLNGEIRTIPEIDPYRYPLRVEIEKNTIDNINLLSSDIVILSPEPNSTIYFDDLLISLSYFNIDNIDMNSIEIWIDDINMTNRAKIYSYHLTLEPPVLSSGEHKVELFMSNTSGISFSPLKWTFNVLSNNLPIKEKVSYNGRIWNDYTDNTVDNINSNYNILNLDFKVNSEWINVNSKFKKSSLENNFEQARDRQSLILKNKFVTFHFGDFYPKVGNYAISGNRIRGFGFNLKTNKFQINYINGDLLRAIQGDPMNGALEVSDYYIEYDTLASADYNMLSLSRNNYTFEKNINALRISFGNSESFNFGINLLKAKDNISSVNKHINNPIISLPEEFDLYNSDQFIDKNNNDIFDGDDVLYLDINENGFFDSFTNIENFVDGSIFENPDTSIIIIGTINETIGDETTEYNVKQYIWDLKMIYADNSSLKDGINNNFPAMVDNIEFLDSLWNGSKPQDNIVVGSDININFRDKIKIESGISFSLNNENIWNPIKGINDFDTYADDYEDCYYARTYEDNFDDLYYWDECNLYDINTNQIVDNSISDSFVADSGLALDAIPDPNDFSDIFHYNFDAVPVIPFYSLISTMEGVCNIGTCSTDGNLTTQDSCDDEWVSINSEQECLNSSGKWEDSITFSDIINSPEVAYNLDISLKYNIQQIKFGIRQIGASFYSAANPFLQKDSREKYFTNRIRLFENRLFLSLKWKSIENGLLDESSAAKTDKYDINMSIYPGLNIPTFSIGYGLHNKESGKLAETDSTLWEEEYSEYNLPTLDTRYKTETENLNFSLSHNFKINNVKQSLSLTYYNSDKEDLLYDELGIIDNVIDTSYISPRSTSTSYSMNIQTNYNQKWQSNFYYSSNYFDFAQLPTDNFTSPYFQKQNLSTFSIGFNYYPDALVYEVGSNIDCSSGEGSTEYNQYGIKIYTKIKLFENLMISFHYSNKLKTITEESIDTDYTNSIVKANLNYKF